MIDWSLIGRLEGRRLEAYVPDSGNSGATIASGCDLAWLSDRERAQMPGLCGLRFAPYVGRVGAEAAAFVKAHPLTISPGDADGVDRVTFGDETATLSSAYTRDSLSSFISLPDRAQTVLASVGFQYGNLRRRTPRFWAFAIARHYAGMVDELRNFGDAWPTRRNAEADYLAAIL
jgi:hypothetical protein